MAHIRGAEGATTHGHLMPSTPEMVPLPTRSHPNVKVAAKVLEPLSDEAVDGFIDKTIEAIAEMYQFGPHNVRSPLNAVQTLSLLHELRQRRANDF